jgi:hypothetical protein
MKSAFQTGKLLGSGESLSSPSPLTLGTPGFVVATLLAAALFFSIGAFVWWLTQHLHWA